MYILYTIFNSITSTFYSFGEYRRNYHVSKILEIFNLMRKLIHFLFIIFILYKNIRIYICINYTI